MLADGHTRKHELVVAASALTTTTHRHRELKFVATAGSAQAFVCKMVAVVVVEAGEAVLLLEMRSGTAQISTAAAWLTTLLY